MDHSAINTYLPTVPPSAAIVMMVMTMARVVVDMVVLIIVMMILSTVVLVDFMVPARLTPGDDSSDSCANEGAETESEDGIQELHRSREDVAENRELEAGDQRMQHNRLYTSLLFPKNSFAD